MKPLRLLLSSLWCVGVLSACDGVSLPEEGAPELATQETRLDGEPPADTDEDGWPMQGTHLQGSPLESVSFQGGTWKGMPLSGLHLEKGELVGSVRLALVGTTPSLTACASTTAGVTRGCGFTSLGVGACTPGASVQLGGGSCGGLGACTGDPVVRVCEGNEPCEHTRALVSGDDACASLCPSVTFTCPASGMYNVLAGPYRSGESWSLKPQPSSGELPGGTRTVRGTDMDEARLQGLVRTSVIGHPEPVYFNVGLRVDAVASAAAVGAPWDKSPSTFLYKVKRLKADGTDLSDMCTGAGSTQWAVPVSGVFHADGARDDSDPSRFTFGCDTGVIAKCYRWGYQPWLPSQSPAQEPDMMKNAHWTCTRMARADYCGNGNSHTQDGTPIHPWDELPAPVHPLAANTPTPLFEAGWNTQGAVCLSHARWATKPPTTSTCPNGLVAPSWLVPGAPGVACPAGQRWHVDSAGARHRCATVCDTPQEARDYVNSVRHFNESHYNGT